MLAVITLDLARLVLGLVLVVSGGLKLFEPSGFYLDVLQFELVGPSVAAMVVYGVPVFELLVAICLLSGRALGGALWWTALAMIAFTALHIRVLVLGQEIACGCFGSANTALISGWTVARNASFALLALVGFLSYWMTGKE